MKILHLSDPIHGWIDITFGLDPVRYTLTVSDVPNDCLCDLAAATSRLLRGATDETVAFSLEPHFAKCKMHRDSDILQIVLMHPDHETPVFTDTFPLLAFAHRLRFELLKIQSRYSTEDGWTQPFPEREIMSLA